MLERLLARRLGDLAEVSNLIDPSQIGGRLQKSATDACVLLQNFVQEQRKLGRTTTTAFLDIKGAYDHVAKNQLLAILAKLGLPYSLISWVKSFMEKRQLRLAFDGQIEEFSNIAIGIPQGSLISPILFLIYTRFLFKLILKSCF